MIGESRGSVARNWTLVVASGAIGLIVFGMVGAEVFGRESTPFDAAIRASIAAHQRPAAHSFFFWVTTIGATRTMYVLAILAASYIWRRAGRRAAASILIVPPLAAGMYETVKRIVGRARPPGFNRLSDSAYSFPSAHATASAAVCCTLAYVFWREGLVGRASALGLGIVVPLLVGASRVYLDVHWATDVVGGWSAGLVIAALSGGLYNRARGGTAARNAAKS